MNTDQIRTQRLHIDELAENWQAARLSADEVTGKRLDTIKELTQIATAVIARAESESIIDLLYAMTDGALPLTDAELNTLTDIARDVQEADTEDRLKKLETRLAFVMSLLAETLPPFEQGILEIEEKNIDDELYERYDAHLFGKGEGIGIDEMKRRAAKAEKKLANAESYRNDLPETGNE